MALSVKDIVGLESFRGLKLISGGGGLENTVCTAGIADYEFDKDVEYDNETPFERDSFVITSFLFAKDDKSRIIDAVEKLYEYGTAALAYKTIIYEDLPEEVIEFSNSHNYPVFSFRKDVYFENIIYEVMSAVENYDNNILSELSVKAMIERNLRACDVEQISRNVSLLFKNYAVAVYLKNKPGDSTFDAERILRSFYVSKGLKRKAILTEYDGGIFVVMTSAYNEMDKFRVILKEVAENLGINLDGCYASASNIYRPYTDLDSCFRESYNAYVASVTNEIDYCSYNNIGAFKYLVPLRGNYDLNKFSSDIIEPIKEKEELLSTAIALVINNGDINAAAVDCNCHHNTVRYRVAKIKELTGNDDMTEFEFYNELSTAVRVYLMQLKLNVI